MHLFKRSVATPLLAPGEGGSTTDGADDAHDPSATGADGADPSMGAADDDADASDSDGQDADAADDADGRDGQADDDDDSDDAAIHDSGRPLEERFAALVKKHTKVKRQNFKHRTLVQLARDLNITPKSLTELVEKAQRLDALERGGPQAKALLRRLLEDDDAADDTGRTGRPAKSGKGRDADDVIEFDEASVPFDTQSENGKWFVNEAKRSRQLDARVTSTLDRIEQRLNQIEGGVAQRFEQTERKEIAGKWQTALDAGAKQIENKGLRTMFEDNVKNMWHRTGGKDRAGHPLDPQKVVRHYLNLLGIKPKATAISRHADAQRIANRNQERPRHQGGQGQPAPANNQRPKTLAEVTRNLRQRVAAGT